MKRSLMTGVLSVFGGKAAMFVVTLATTPILVRYLGSGRYGDYAFLMSVFAMLMILVSSGVGDGVRKFVVEDRSLPNWEAHVVGYYVRHATLLAVAGSGVVALLAASGLVGRFVDEALEPYFYLLSAMVIAAQFRELVRRTLMGFGKEHYAEVLRVAKNVCFAGFGIGLVVLGHGVTGVLVGHLASSLLAALAGIVLVHRHVSLSYVFERAPVSFPKRELLTFNGYTIVFIMLMTSLYHVDLLMLRPMAGSDQTGYYKGALALAEFLWFAPVALQTVFVHSTSELWSKGRTGKISELASRTTRFTFLLTALLAIGIAALADVFVPLYYGEAFTPAVEPLLLLLPGALGFAVARPIFAIGQGKGDMRVLVAATGGAAGINLVLNALLIPRYGMAGAAVATSVGYASMLVVHVAAARVVGFDPIRDIRPIRTGLTVVASGAAILLVARSIRDPLVALVAVPPIGLVLFGSLAFATGAVDAHEIRSLVDSLPLPSIPMPTIQAASPSTEQLESVMMILGIVLLVAAVALAAPVSSFIGAVDDRDDPSSGDNATGDGITPANSSVVTASPTATPTATPNETATPTSTPNETATPTETDDDGGFWGPILSDDTPTPTESDDDGDGDEGDDEDDGWSDPDTSTPEPDPTATPEPNATATPAPEPTDTPTDTPTDEPPATSTAEPTPTDTPVDEPTASPTATPTATPTDEPTPTATPTDEPTATPTAEPTTPTAEPTDTPTDGTTPTENTQQTATATSSESGSTAETQSSDGGAYFFVPPAWIADLVPGTPNVR